MKTRLSILGLTLAMAAACLAQSPTTNAPGARSVSNSQSVTNPPDPKVILSTASIYPYPILNTNGQVIWPPYFWQTNASPAGGVLPSQNGIATNLTAKSGSFTGTHNGDGRGMTNLLGTVTPEQFGAVGDGNTLDDAAFAAACQWAQMNTTAGHSYKLLIGGLGNRYHLSQTIVITNGFTIEGPRPWNNSYYVISPSNSWTIYFTGNTNLFYAPTNYVVNGFTVKNVEAVGPWNYATPAVNTNSCFLNIQGFNASSAFVGQHNTVEGVGLKNWGIGVYAANQALFWMHDCWFQDLMHGFQQWGSGARSVVDRFTVTGVSTNGVLFGQGEMVLNQYQPLVSGYALNTCPTNLWYLTLNNPLIETYGLSWSNWPINLQFVGGGSLAVAQISGGTSFSDGVPCPQIYSTNVLLRLNGFKPSSDGNGFAIVCGDQFASYISSVDDMWPGYQVTNSASGKTYYTPQNHYSPLVLDKSMGFMPSAISNNVLLVNGNSMQYGFATNYAGIQVMNTNQTFALSMAVGGQADFGTYLRSYTIPTGNNNLTLEFGSRWGGAGAGGMWLRNETGASGGGSVGIGTNQPQAKLHVAGSIRADGGLLVTSNTFPVTANWANLAPSGCAFWNSNGVHGYWVITNSITQSASTNQAW